MSKDITRQDILMKHDTWLFRIMMKKTHRLQDLQQFWLFRELMFKHWDKFTDGDSPSDERTKA